MRREIEDEMQERNVNLSMNLNRDSRRKFNNYKVGLPDEKELNQIFLGSNK